LPRRHLDQCKVCGYQVSLTAGTLLHRSRVPLPQWFWAAYVMSTVTPGLSALQLQRVLGLGSYRTAWLLCHKLRRATVRPGRAPLVGPVEVDEAFIGGREIGVVGRQTVTKTLIAVAVEVRGRRAGRVRLQVIPDAATNTLTAFVRTQVAAGSQVITDGWAGYTALTAQGHRHEPRPQRAPANASRLLPWVHRVVSNLKTWLLGTHHGVDPYHLPYYLDEFAFRFNRRFVREHAFRSLLGIGVQQPATTYKQLRSSESGA
jgi:transposase-like protein